METSEVDQAWINQNTMKPFCKVPEKKSSLNWAPLLFPSIHARKHGKFSPNAYVTYSLISTVKVSFLYNYNYWMVMNQEPKKY